MKKNNVWGEKSFNVVSSVYHVGHSISVNIASSWLASRPVITLSSNVYITSGDGTAPNPYSLDI